MDMRFWIKMTGLVCIFLACVFVGAQQERRMKQRWLFLREMQEMLLVLEKEMVFHHAAVTEAFRYAAGSCRTSLRQVFETAAAQIEKRDQTSFEEIWKTAIRKEIPGNLLTESELLAMQNAAVALCGTDTVMQQTLLQQHADRFREMSREEEENYREKGSLVRRLMTAAGAFLVILLI